MSRFGRKLTFSDYEITRDGKVINKLSGETVKAQPNDKGYLRVGICGKLRFVHRLVAEKFLPNPENKPQVNHIDGNKTNNNVDNLEWVTNKANREHAVKNSLIVSGDKCPWAKLSVKDIEEIRSLYPTHMITDIAKMYNVNRKTISDIVHWKHGKQLKRYAELTQIESVRSRG